MDNFHLARVHRVLNKLDQVRTLGLSCFGSNSHGFRLNPPLSNAEILAFESAYRIRLPEAYRAFLEHAGNGGAGPYYGIYPLSKWDDFANQVLDEIPDDILARPSALQPELVQAADQWSENDTLSLYQGTLSLGTQGCTYATQLIVSGSYAGRIVYVDADRDSAAYMVHEQDFLDWYERWLDELLQGYKIDWFGVGPKGGEEDFFRILNDPQASDKFKTEAANAFRRLPQLSEGAASHIPTYLNVPIEGVRSGILATMHTFKILKSIDAVAQLLNDPSAAVRIQAVITIMDLDPEHNVDAVLRILREDTNADVVNAAFRKLNAIGRLSKSDLLDIIEHSPFDRLRSSAAYHVKWVNTDQPFLIHMLSETNERIRRYAILGLRQIKAQSALPQVLTLLEQEKDQLVVDNILEMLGEFADPSTVTTLLHWATSEDDFHRLEAVDALVKIGDERALPLITAMLMDNRKPERRNSAGFTSQSNIHSIAYLVQKSLKESSNPAFRRLS